MNSIKAEFQICIYDTTNDKLRFSIGLKNTSEQTLRDLLRLNEPGQPIACLPITWNQAKSLENCLESRLPERDANMEIFLEAFRP